MSRRKGEITPSRIDRDWPHQVEIAIPELGLGNRLNEMHQFCTAEGLRPKGRGRTRLVGGKVVDMSCWCFDTPEAADRFHTRFGGERVTIEPKKWGR